MRTQATRTVRDLIILTLLAWATQTLVSQWGFGADEVFMPREFGRPVTVELQAEAAVTAGAVRLRQVARWSPADEQAMGQVGELVIARFEKGKTTLNLELGQIKRTLEEAGANLAAVNFCGAMSCLVRRSDAAEKAPAGQPVRAAVNGTSTTPVETGRLSVSSPVPARTLREILTEDLVARLGVPEEQLQVSFTGQDEKLVNLAEPQVKFELIKQPWKRLGDVSWDVLVTLPEAAQQRVTVRGNVRMWQTQLLTVRPLAFKQVIRQEDVAEKRVLVDRLSDEPMLSREQAVGQMAGRDLGAGALVTGKMISPVMFARVGQFVTVFVEVGKVQLKWVAEARESGTYGQTIRVRKPGTREEFSVVLTGPQTGKLVSGAAGAAVSMK